MANPWLLMESIWHYVHFLHVVITQNGMKYSAIHRRDPSGLLEAVPQRREVPVDGWLIFCVLWVAYSQSSTYL